MKRESGQQKRPGYRNERNRFHLNGFLNEMRPQQTAFEAEREAWGRRSREARGGSDG